jgi:hypothetical protein
MAFDITHVLNSMKEAAVDAVRDDVESVPDYLLQIIENEKESLKTLAEARLTGEVSENEFLRELEREKKVLETEMLTISIMTKAIAQKAVNAAMNALKDAIQLAL